MVRIIKLTYTIGLIQALNWSAGYEDEIIEPENIMAEIEKRLMEGMSSGDRVDENDEDILSP